MSDNRFQKDNIQVYRKKWHMNVGVIIFGVILLYLIVTVLTYVTDKRISVYEVREGSILTDNAYTGLVLRKEEIVYAEKDGYVNYLAPEGVKVGAKSQVFCLSDEKLELSAGAEASKDAEKKDEAESKDTEETADANTDGENTKDDGEGGDSKETDSETDGEFTFDEQEQVIQLAQNFNEGFRDLQFRDAYTLKDSVGSILSSRSAQSRQEQVSALLEDKQKGVEVYNAAKDGIVEYVIDGYEDITADQITTDMLARTNVEETVISNNSKASKGDPVYKLITDEAWTVIIELDDEMAKELMEKTSVQVKFSKDNHTSWGAFQVYNTEDGNLGFITFEQSMVRYAGQRFLDIELILEDESGLKIPKSAVTEKEFYTVPEAYITQGGDSSSDGVLLKRKDGSTKFQSSSIYYKDSEKGLVYLRLKDFTYGDVIVKPDSQEEYELKETASLKGVYNINKGYAEFWQVNILCESDEYYIVESGSNYSLTNYDHIALDGNDIQEEELVF